MNLTRITVGILGFVICGGMAALQTWACFNRPMRKRGFHAGWAVWFGLLALWAPQAHASPPSVVMIMTDDQAALDGRLVEAMPTVRDVFARQGVTFTDFHSESPLCCPARASFLTGQHVHNHGVIANEASLFNPDETLATELHAQGYHTMLVGKYLNRFGDIRLDRRRLPGWDQYFILEKVKYFNYKVDENGAERAYGDAAADYSTDVIAHKAAAWIREAPRDKPLLAWVTPIAPHPPNTAAPRHENAACDVPAWSSPNYNERDVSDKPRYVQETPLLRQDKLSLERTCRTLLAVDDLVREVRQALADTGRLNSTLVFYAGDNGMNAGAHRLTHKQAPYATEIPFYASQPGTYWPRIVTTPVLNIDVAPTLCEFAGCSMGPYPNGQQTADGVSFASLLRGSANPIHSSYLTQMIAIKHAGLDNPPPAWAAITTPRWHYIEYVTGERELYDRQADPWELENVANLGIHAGDEAILSAQLALLKAQRGA